MVQKVYYPFLENALMITSVVHLMSHLVDVIVSSALLIQQITTFTNNFILWLIHGWRRCI